MGQHHAITLSDEKFEFTSKLKSILGGVIVVGLIITLIGVFQIKNASHHGDHTALVSASEAVSGSHEGGHHGPTWVTRLWANLLINTYYFLIIALAGTFFIAVNYLANAGWATGIKRIPEAFGAYLPFGLISLIIVTYFGGHDLYHWLADGITDPNSPNYDAIIAGKSAILNSGWLIWGSLIIGAIWVIFHFLLTKASRQEDQEGGLKFFDKSVKLSAAFTFIFAFSFSVFVWVNIMSVDPHWYSTIYVIYNFAISFVTGLTVMCLIVLYLKSKGYLSFINGEHIHDLGKFMFAFSIFWTYIWLAQYLLIWYANIPEETIYYWERMMNSTYFRTLFFTNIGLNFVIPFITLMTRDNKRNPKVLFFVGGIILIGHWLDLYLMIMPGTVKDMSSIGALEIGMPLVFAGIFLFIVFNALTKANLFPKNHPYLEESVHHDVGP